MINRSHIRHYPPVKQQRCEKCKYYYIDTYGNHVCINGDSERITDYIHANDYCNQYDSKR